jgi:hypothetical protein
MYKISESSKFDFTFYNALPSVEEADHTVREKGMLNDFLGKASNIICSYEMQYRFGVALLHKHSTIEHDEKMVEYSEIVDGRDELVTRPYKSSALQTEVCPSIWSLSKGDFLPLEFTADSLAKNLFQNGVVSLSLLSHFVELVDQSPIGHLFGLAVVSRTLYGNAKKGEIAVEYSKSEDRSNNVFLCRQEDIIGKTIETAWTFETKAGSDLHCANNCRKQCWSVEDGHDKIHRQHHTPNPG